VEHKQDVWLANSSDGMAWKMKLTVDFFIRFNMKKCLQLLIPSSDTSLKALSCGHDKQSTSHVITLLSCCAALEGVSLQIHTQLSSRQANLMKFFQSTTSGSLDCNVRYQPGEEFYLFRDDDGRRYD
jgi:hypothetical protein